MRCSDFNADDRPLPAPRLTQPWWVLVYDWEPDQGGERPGHSTPPFRLPSIMGASTCLSATRNYYTFTGLVGYCENRFVKTDFQFDASENQFVKNEIQFETF